MDGISIISFILISLLIMCAIAQIVLNVLIYNNSSKKCECTQTATPTSTPTPVPFSFTETKGYCMPNNTGIFEGDNLTLEECKAECNTTNCMAYELKNIADGKGVCHTFTKRADNTTISGDGANDVKCFKR